MPESSLPGLDELRALQPGTPLPWTCFNVWGPHTDGLLRALRIGDVLGGGFTVQPGGDIAASREDFEYIVAAANALPGLLARLARAEQTLPEVRDFYLSGPMTGYAEFNCPAFAAATAPLRALGKSVWNPAENFAGRTDLSYADYISEDVRQVLRARAVAVLPGWEKSRGAALEVHLARTLGIPVVDAATLAPIADGAADLRARLARAEQERDEARRTLAEIGRGMWVKRPCPAHVARFELECPACNGKNSEWVSTP